jgi:Flp pilus assembly protein TadD
MNDIPMPELTLEQAAQMAQEHLQARRPSECAQLCDQILALQPDFLDAIYLLAKARIQLNDLPGAVAACRRVVELLPQAPMAYNNLAAALLASGQIDESIAALCKSLSLSPNQAQVEVDYAEALRQAGRIPDAIAACRRAIELQPDLPLAHMKLGESLLLTGDYRAGMPEYFWRYRLVFSQPDHYAEFYSKLWDGSDLHGKRILIGAEGGFGDVIQFSRYAPLVTQRGGKVSLASPPELYRLMQTLPGVDEITITGQPPPVWDCHCLCMHLPALFNSSPDDVPNRTPYLFADRALTDRWKDRLAPFSGRLKVGLVWAGSSTHRYRRARNLPAKSLAPLAGVTGVSFFSLQKGEAEQSSAAGLFSQPLQWTDWSAELRDFADTASLISHMDLVIAADTAVAHLAGALGRPVWVMMPFLPDWRWLLGRSDTPWYPTMRLYRQTRADDWQTVVGSVATDLGAARAMP